MKKARFQAVEGIRAGDSWTITRTFTQDDVMAFGDLSRDYNPVHYDQRFASAKNFKGPVCHGLLTASMIAEIGGQLGWLAASMHFVFKKPVYFGDTVQCRLTIEEIDDRGFAKALASYHNQDGQLVLEAVLTGILPGEQERGVMRAMLAEGDPTNKIR